MHDRGVKAESETIGHVARFGVPQRTLVPVKVGQGVKFLEAAYARWIERQRALLEWVESNG